MLYLLIFFLVYLVLNILENFYREKWKYDKNYVKWSRKWHSIQWIRWVVVFLFISYLTLNLKTLVILLPLSVIWKILYDGCLNILRNRNFWYVSSHTNLSVMEKYSKKSYKIVALVLSIAIAVLWMKLV